MTAYESIFRVANFGALIAWILLLAGVVFGWRRVVERFCGLIVPVLLATAYVGLLLSNFGAAKGDFSSLAGVEALFRSRPAVLAGWLHYLAFDLLIGVAIGRIFLEERLPRVLLLPVLPLTFFFGPAGWLLFQAIRFVRRDASPARPAAEAGPVKSPRRKARTA